MRKKRYKLTAKVIYYIYRNIVILQPVIYKRFRKVNISCCCTLAAKIQSEFYERNWQLSYGIRPWVFHLFSNVNIQAKSHFAIFQVLLFLRSTCCFQFLCSDYGTVWAITLHFVCTIITFKNLNSFKYPTKIRLCSQPNQNHLLRDLFSFSACWHKRWPR